jgi:hypothetical protein
MVTHESHHARQAARDSDKARQAALLLHGLSPEARREVIAKLDVATASRLEPLLAELTTLGLSPSLGRQLYAETLVAAESSQSVATPEDQAARLSADEVAHALSACAPTTVALIFRARAWPWRMDVLDRIPNAHREFVIQHLSHEPGAPAPAVTRALCERLCTQAAQVRQEIRRLNAGRKLPATGIRKWLPWMR